MGNFVDISRLHHSYLMVGDVNQSKKLVDDFLIGNNILISNNPDIVFYDIDTLNIDYARSLAESSSRKDFGSNKKFFILKINIITEEAQNALLKVFEEPTSGTHFFILMPQDILLPTLRSRMQIIYLENGSQKSSQNSILKKGIAHRLEMIKEITDGISDEEKTKQDAINLLNRVEEELYANDILKNSDKLRVCQLTREALYDRGAPIKMILENLMLSV